MATYKITGARYLRKYTAKNLSPAYAAALDAQTVVDEFCNIPWEAVEPKTSQFAYHTEEVINKETGRSGLDENVSIRDSLDAALFCAEHAAGMHRAYAQAMCLRFTLPDDAVGASLTSLKLKVSSDPYNSGGCRVSAFTNSSGEIPMNCNTVRTGAVHAEAQVPRTSQTSSGTTYWYAAQGTVTLTPESAITLQKYLFVFFGLEDYSITRGNWLEGSATLKNLVEITTSAAVTGWTDGETYDLAQAPGALQSLAIIDKGAGEAFVKHGIITVGNLGSTKNMDYDLNTVALGIYCQPDWPSDVFAANNLLSKFHDGALEAMPTGSASFADLVGRFFTAYGYDSDFINHYKICDMSGLAFNLYGQHFTRSASDREDIPGHNSDQYKYTLQTGIIWAPLCLPVGFAPKTLSLQILNFSQDNVFNSDLSGPARGINVSTDAGKAEVVAALAAKNYCYNIWIKPGYISDVGDLYKNPHLYLADVHQLEGWQLLASAPPASREWITILDDGSDAYRRRRLLDNISVSCANRFAAPVMSVLVSVKYDLASIQYGQLLDMDWAGGLLGGYANSGKRGEAGWLGQGFNAHGVFYSLTLSA